MTFSLTSSQLLDLASYQRTLKNLIATFAGSSSNGNRTPSKADTTDLTEVCLGSGAAVVLDTSVLLLPTTTTASLKPDSHPQQLSSSQTYPLAFVATSQVSSLLFRHTSPLTSTHTSWPVLYYLRLPLNPLTHAIQCHVSARRLCPRHVSFLDRILRRLCDASPGAFMIGYSDGMSGVDAGTEVVYSGESTGSSSSASSASSSSAPHLHPHPHPHPHTHTHTQPPSHPSTFPLPQHHPHPPQPSSHLANITGLTEQSSAVAGHKDVRESDNQPSGLVGHIEHSLSPAIIEGNNHQHHHSNSNNPSRLEDPLLPSARSLKTLKDNIAAATTSSKITAEGPTILQARDRPGPVRVAGTVLEVNNETTEVGLYDFGSVDDGEIFLDASPGLGMDDVHDTLWVH